MPTATLAIDTSFAAEPWAALDAQDGWQEFSRPLAGSQDKWESFLAIEGMPCAACTLTIEQALLQVAGVESVQVNGGTAVARIVWMPGPCRPSEWMDALRRAGYSGLPGRTSCSRSRAARGAPVLWRCWSRVLVMR